MATPDPLKKIKGAGTTFWVYTGQGDAFGHALDDDVWMRLAAIKELQPGEMSADEEDDTYLDDENPDWKSSIQGQKSAGETSITLAWKPGEEGQKKLAVFFDTGTVEAWRIKYPNGTVDVFKGWVSSLGKSVQSKEVITRTVKIKGVGRPLLAEDKAPSEVRVTAVTVSPDAVSVEAGSTAALTVTLLPDNATHRGVQVKSSHPDIATVTVKDLNVTVTGVKPGTASVVVITDDGGLVAVATATVTEKKK
ncbi:phage tail protein [Escherichia coli]|uniref:phage tail protein n=1 Tax=Escherichia coli TaxID=562 RepID=UPI00135E0131|nr:phage tail protein [Escherichia coli]MXF06687.1 phage tail protein [Escherichia coli]